MPCRPLAAGGGETRLNGAPPGTYSSFNRDETLTEDFLHGYTYGHAHCGKHKGAVTVTMGVTNDGANSHALGVAWANEVTKANNDFIIAALEGILVTWGSSDIEGGFGPPGPVFTWLSGYESSPFQTPFVNTGSADGCPPYGNCDVIADGGENSPWTQQLYWDLGVTRRGHMRLSFPQIYCRGQAHEWQQISLWGANHAGGKDVFRSDLTQGGRPSGCVGAVGPYIANGYTATSTFLGDLRSNAKTSQSSIPYLQIVSGV